MYQWDDDTPATLDGSTTKVLKVRNPQGRHGCNIGTRKIIQEQEQWIVNADKNGKALKRHQL